MYSLYYILILLLALLSHTPLSRYTICYNHCIMHSAFLVEHLKRVQLYKHRWRHCEEAKKKTKEAGEQFA